MTPITVEDLTTGVLNGTGVFDKLMSAGKAHLEAEYGKDRIKGPEYATVYLGMMDTVMNQSIQFLLQTRRMVVELALVEQQTLNAVTEGEVLVAQKCKLEAEFDLLVNTNLKTTAEIQLLIQKTATEKAQVLELGVDENSIIGKQKQLYNAQTEGFTRDAEQKTAKVMVDTWNARRMTDEGTVADGTNMLNDAAVGRAVNKLLAGVGA